MKRFAPQDAHKPVRYFLASAFVLSVAFIVLLAACSGAKKSSGFDDGTGAGTDAGGGFGKLGGEGGGPCINLQCQQTCANTSISGSVYDPSGQTPLYNVIVYVPNTDVPDFTDGATCDKCGTVAASPVVSALTDTNGTFKLTNAPDGDNIPLVVQVGKWQRKYTIPHVNSCVDNPVDKELTRLPKNSSEGHLPKIAVTTGGYDSLECFIKRIGVDIGEFSDGGGSGRIQLYVGDGGGSQLDNSTPSAYSPVGSAFWDSESNLAAYDMVALTCEGEEYGSDKPSTALDAMRDYTKNGGRVFATHYHYYWFKNEAETANIANWSTSVFGSTYTVDTTFPKGADFADWLQNVGATTTKGVIDLTEVADDVGTLKGTAATRWIYTGSASSYSTKYMTFNTPVGAAPADQCGRVVYSDIHVANTSSPSNTSSTSFPSLCDTSPLTAQEKALEFLFFDLNACVQDDSQKPQPPR